MSQQVQSFTGKVALVAGASRGIGAVTARAFAEAGAAVALAARDQAPLESVAASIRAAGGTAIAGMRGFTGLSAYVAGKAGIIGLTRVAALDYADQGIRINVVAPGPILTHHLERAGEEAQRLAGLSTPMRRIGRRGGRRRGALALLRPGLLHHRCHPADRRRPVCRPQASSHLHAREAYAGARRCVIIAGNCKEEWDMSIFESSPWSDRVLSILRIVAGIVFVSAGTMKLFNYPPSPVPMPPLELMSLIGIAGILETFGGLAIVLGLFTRPVAFILSGEMAVAYFHAHFPQSIFPTINNGVGSVLYCFLFLYMAFAGGGAWSIDAALARSRGRL